MTNGDNPGFSDTPINRGDGSDGDSPWIRELAEAQKGTADRSLAESEPVATQVDLRTSWADGAERDRNVLNMVIAASSSPFRTAQRQIKEDAAAVA